MQHRGLHGRAPRVFVALLCGLSALSALLPAAGAARVDAYRQMLMEGRYTIRYDNITPPPRTTNRDRLELFGKSGMDVSRNDYLTNRQRSGIIVSDGRDRYEEIGDGQFDMCRLSLGKDVYNFTKYRKGDRCEYVGTGRNKVESNAKNYLAEIVEGQSFGDEDVSRLLNALLPPESKSANLPDYAYAAGGTLADGTAYEDWKGSLGGLASVVRYYFDGNRLIKIASAEYRRKEDGSMDGRRCIVRIREFSPAPDRSLLRLPEGVKDVTKRKKEGKG